jgi:hypothetical protein
MNTDTRNLQSAVVLKDGYIHLAAWTHTFHEAPSIGEFIEIPAHLQENLAGYEPRAFVSRIKRRGNLLDLVEAEAICKVKAQDRPVIVINSDRIRAELRPAAEAHVRSTLRFPRIHWEGSTQPDPVVRFHDPSTGRKSCPPEVRAGLIDLLYQPAASVC